MGFFDDESDEVAGSPTGGAFDEIADAFSSAAGVVEDAVDVGSVNLATAAHAVGERIKAAEDAIEAGDELAPWSGVVAGAAMAQVHAVETVNDVIHGDVDAAIDHAVSLGEDVLDVATLGVAGQVSDAIESGVQGVTGEDFSLHDRAVAQAHHYLDSATELADDVASGNLAEVPLDLARIQLDLIGANLPSEAVTDLFAITGETTVEESADPIEALDHGIYEPELEPVPFSFDGIDHEPESDVDQVAIFEPEAGPDHSINSDESWAL